MTPDLWVGMIVLGTLFALEGVLPFYVRGRERYAHAGRNLGLAIVAGAVGAALAPLLMASAELAAQRGLGLCNWLGLGGVACVVVALLLFDLWMYAWHRANHRLPLLWRFHRVHHTDPAMDCTTALRFHPGEIVLSSLANCLVLIALGMSFEMLVLYKTIMVAVILFHHSSLAVPGGLDRALRPLIVTPAMHRVHHSELQRETDSNYGTIFSFWDRLFRSFRLREDACTIRFGIGRFGETEWQRPLRLLMLPFQPAQSDPTRRS
ncbi:MAG: sterol desaturase family protein [Thiocapsa sp.]|jgi:sterol desaturase/sphingolipid hydroxylase (fatty acid hydroxylase superfamily)|nr:sterol desaturase family protein [Thiocapsa sp.]MCG6985234.1 sterol desaturase family protein [Thiocapsa sp.]